MNDAEKSIAKLIKANRRIRCALLAIGVAVIFHERKINKLEEALKEPMTDA